MDILSFILCCGIFHCMEFNLPKVEGERVYRIDSKHYLLKACTQSPLIESQLVLLTYRIYNLNLLILLERDLQLSK